MGNGHDPPCVGVMPIYYSITDLHFISPLFTFFFFALFLGIFHSASTPRCQGTTLL